MTQRDFPPIYGAKFIDNNTAVMQGTGYDHHLFSKMIAGYSFDKNLMIYYSREATGNSRIIESGFTEIKPVGRTQFIAPLDISSSKTKVAFQALYPDESNTKATLWLSLWDLETDKVDRIVKISQPQEPDKPGLFEQRAQIISFSPVQKSNLIAVATGENILIIDYKEKKIVKNLSDCNPKNIKWSPNEKEIGLLKKGIYKEEYQENEKCVVTSPPSLWLYDIGKDKLKKIYEDSDCFDFLWVPGKV